MAYTISHLVAQGSTQGNKKVSYLRVTADAAEGVIPASASRLRVIEFPTVIAQSAISNPKLMMNADSSGVASYGALGISGVTTGNVFLVKLEGR